MEEPPESIKDLSVVLDILQPLESKWLDVGIHLKIKKDTILDSIEANHGKDVHRCLTEVIAYWQKNEDEPSWEKLANAVKKVGGHSDVLKSIPGHLPTMASTGVITGEDSDSGFETSSSTPPSQASSDSEQDVFDTSSLSPGCGCGECNIHKMCTEGCPKPDYANRLPILTKFTGGETASETASKVQSGSTSRQHSADSFEQETSDLCEHFGSLVTDVCKSLKTLADKDEVALYLLNSFPILKRKEAEINGARDMTKLFTVVTVQACSWFNFDIIKRLIKKFGSADDRKRLAKYQQHFESFAKQRLPQGMTHVELGSKAGMTGCKKLVIKVDREWESISIGELERLRREFAKILKVDRKNLYLADVNEGCIMLTLMIPEEIANTLSLRKLTSAQKQMLASERVVRLSCGRLKWSRPSSSTTQQLSSSDSEEYVLDEQPKEKCHRKAETRPVRNGSSSRMSYVKVLTSSCLLLVAIAVLLFLNMSSTSTPSFAWNATNRSATCKFNVNQIRPGMLNAAIQRDKFEPLVRPGTLNTTIERDKLEPLVRPGTLNTMIQRDEFKLLVRPGTLNTTIQRDKFELLVRLSTLNPAILQLDIFGPPVRLSTFNATIQLEPPVAPWRYWNRGSFQSGQPRPLVNVLNTTDTLLKLSDKMEMLPCAINPGKLPIRVRWTQHSRIFLTVLPREWIDRNEKLRSLYGSTTVQSRLKNWVVNNSPPMIRLSWELGLDTYQVHKEAIQKKLLRLNSDEQSLCHVGLEIGTDIYHVAIIIQNLMTYLFWKKECHIIPKEHLQLQAFYLTSDRNPPVIRLNWELGLDKYQVHKETIQKLGPFSGQQCQQYTSDSRSTKSTSLKVLSTCIYSSTRQRIFQSVTLRNYLTTISISTPRGWLTMRQPRMRLTILRNLKVLSIYSSTRQRIFQFVTLRNYSSSLTQFVLVSFIGILFIVCLTISKYWRIGQSKRKEGSYGELGEFISMQDRTSNRMSAVVIYNTTKQLILAELTSSPNQVLIQNLITRYHELLLNPRVCAVFIVYNPSVQQDETSWLHRMLTECLPGQRNVAILFRNRCDIDESCNRNSLLVVQRHIQLSISTCTSTTECRQSFKDSIPTPTRNDNDDCTTSSQNYYVSQLILFSRQRILHSHKMKGYTFVVLTRLKPSRYISMQY